MAYVVSSGDIESGIILENDSMTVLDGGIAENTTANSGGRVYVSSGGIADCTTLNSGGNMYISSGGTADSATVNEGGYLRIYSGGTATAIVEDGGYVYVTNGATVSFVEHAFSGCVLSKASATVHSGTTAIDATVKGWGFLYVSSGGIVNSATIDVDGIISVLGGTVNSVTVNADGSMHIRDGGTADGTIMTGGGCLLVYSGGTATNIVWTPCEGYVNVYEGGYVTFASEYSGVYFGSGNKLLSSASVMDGKTLDDNFEMYVMNGGTADSTTVNYYGNLYVRDGGTANSATVNEGGTFAVSSGGTANSATVNGGGMIIEDGGTADSITVNGGEFQVSGGGTATNIMLASGGELYVYYGGVATGIVENGGYVDFEDDETVSFVSNSFSGLVLSEASATVHSGTTANSATVNEYGSLRVHSGGIVKSTTVYEDGSLRVSSGGTADSTTVNGGELEVSEGGMANGATVNCGGSMYVSAGGTATGILENGGYVEVDGGATVTFLSNTLSGLVLNYGRNATVHTSTTATSATLDFNGGLYVRGGQADHTTVNDGGKFTVSDNGRADSTTVNDGGSMIVGDGGKAAGVAIHAGGNLEVGSGGSASDATVNDGGSAMVGDGGKATGVTIHAGGGLKVGSGGSASDATVNSGANMFVASNGTATDITVYAGGRLELGSGGTVQSAVISSGGIVTGYVDCHGITFDPGAELQLDLSVISPGNESALVNLAGLAETPDCPSFTLPVSDSQDYGDYKLAENAWGFETKTISVYNSVADFGSLSLDRSVVVGNREYSLNLNGGDLILSVNATQPTQYVYLDFDGEDLARYSNSDLELSFDLSVADPAFSDEQRAAVVSALSEQYGKYNIAFTLARPEGIDYSTLYFGQSPAFAEYGDFFGISETCDGNDQVRDDNAFILLDSGCSDEQILSVASHMLDHIMGFSWSGSVDGSPAILKYAESKALLSLSAGWNQEDPYNKYCPIYPVTGDRCVVGCTNTAASQIIYYWMQNGLLDFTLSLADSDAYQSNRYIMIESSDNPESGHLSFAETNKLLQSFNILDENCIAALCFAAGVVQQADYTSKETSTAWNGDLFIRAGFEKDEAAEQHESGMSYYDVLAYELLHGRPTGVSVRSQSHAIVADGYDSSRNMFHLDFGWGDETTRWYTVEEMDALRLYEGINGYVPVASPDLTIENLSVGKDPVEWKEDVTLSFTVSNEGKKMSEETMAYVYCGDTLLGSCGLNYISPGYSRDFTCTVDASLLPAETITLTVKVGTQKDETGVSEESVVYDNTPKTKWTYLMYFAADNDLDASALDDLISIQRANIDERIDVYVLVDRPEYPWDWEEGEIQTVNGTYRWDSLWTDTRVGRIRHDPGLTVTVDWESWGELDTGSAETLDRFVKWVQAESPSENYALVLWDHGEEFATLCYDFTTDPNLNACLTVSDVSEVVKTNGNIPLVIFNSCLNASDIATTQMAGSTDVMAAPESPSMSSGTTYAYRPFFSTITADMTAREMAEILVRNVREAADMPYPSMLTAIDVTDTRLADSLKALAEAVLAADNIEDRNVLIDAMLTAPRRRCLYTGGMVMQSDLKDMILQTKADPGYSGTSEGFQTALAGVETALDAVVLDYRSAPGDSGHSIGFANVIEVSEKYLGLGYTADKVDKIILDYLTAWYGSNPEWADLLHELAGTYLARNAGVRTAVFDVVDNPDLVDGKVVQVNELGCFSGRGETIDGVALDGDVYFGFSVTAADKSAGGIRVVNDAGVSVSVSLLAGDGSVLVKGDNTIAFSDLAVGDYFLRLASETKCDVAFSFDADWLTGVDRFDYAGSGSNGKHANGNATPDTASVLGAGYYSGLLTSMGDSDFYQFVNTGTGQVRIAVESLDGNCLHVRAFSPKGIPGAGAKYKEGVYTLTMSVGDCLFVEGDANLDKDQVNAYSITVIPYEETPVVLSNLNGTKDGASWEASEVDHLFCAEYSMDNFEHVLSVQTSGWGFDTPELPEGTYQWRVKVLADKDEEGNAIGEDGEWFSGNEIVSDNTPGSPKIVQSDADGNTDVFFAIPNGKWSGRYRAQHGGTLGGWSGTDEIVVIRGKSRIQNLFFGSADVSTLYLTDSRNGDALFVDDVYTDSPEGIAEKTARLFQISEIFAGAGDDIVDMTSQRFAYTGDLTGIHGGDGNDVIWANSGDNQLFGDAGDDRIIGSSGYDFIVGGIGNDRMHGGGGDDIFTFCDNWGTDEVEQLADGSVLLWFASGSMENWDESMLTYTDGENSVKVSGVTADQVTLRFGNDWSMLYSEVTLAGGFHEFSSRCIFEESGGGILA